METRRWAAPDGGAAAAAAIRSGRLVAFPTETVYGLGADARDGSAVAGIYEAKGRPSFNPLIAHVPDLATARLYGDFGSDAARLAEAFWPGPLTLVVPARADCAITHLARAGLASVALRVPAHPVAIELIRRAECPIAAPSANRSGRISPTTADHVAADLFGRIDGILDGGPTSVGVESTIVACDGSDCVLLRPGGLVRSEIERILGRPLANGTDADQTVRAPGMLASHYAPRAAIRLDAREVMPNEAALDFGAQFGSMPADRRLDLSPGADLREAAANLFSHLHRLDASGAACIAVAPIPKSGLGEAITDRLRRAAAPRPGQPIVTTTRPRT